MLRVYYHVTTEANLSSILEHGLTPQEGWDYGDRHTRKWVYLQETPDETGFYGNVVLEIRIPKGVEVRQSVYSEGVYVTKLIPPSHIRVFKRLTARKGVT